MKKLTATLLAPVAALLFGTPAFAAETKARRVDINTATEEQLTALPGVDGEVARKIVEGRPYFKKDDLKEKEVISADAFEKIKKLLDSVC